MTVVPQQYTLHCVTIGGSAYTITLYGNNQQIYSGGYGNGNCIRQLLHSSNGPYDNTVNITWDTESISSGSFSQSVNDDQMYRCNVYFHIDRDDYLTVKSIYIISLSQLLSPSVGQLIQLMLMDIIIVNATSDTDTVTHQVKGGSQSTTTLKGLRVGTTYSITVRAYQDILGPVSNTVSVQTYPGICMS